MLARIQQFIVISIAGLAIIWIVLTWGDSPTLTGLGLLLVFLGHAAFLALEFAVAYRVNRHDPAARAGVLLLIRAWIGEALTAPRVFGWQQPFRWNAIPDCLTQAPNSPKRRGIVFIHGFVSNRGFWNPWLVQMRHRGQVFSAVNLEPVTGSIEDYAAMIETAVQGVTAATGLPPLLICHSMGGLATRAWLRAFQADHRVHHVVSQLFTCYYSNCDNIVFPVSSAMLRGADNRMVAGEAHVALAFNQRVVSETLAMV